MTLDEFEAAYAARSRVTIEQLHAHGRRAEPCDCGDPICEGWQMAHERWFRWPAPKDRLIDMPWPWP